MRRWDYWGGDTYPTYDGELKGKGTAEKALKDQTAMQKTAFDKQMAQLDQLKSSFQGYLSGKTGFDPNLLASMRSQFLNSNNQTFNQAGQQVREALGARGNVGQNPVGGDYAAGLSSLLGARAQSQSQGLLGINAQNAQQALNNQFNAGNILSGNAATLTGTQGVAGAAASNALNQYEAAANTGFGASFMNSFGGALGKVGGNAAQMGLAAL